MQICFINKKLRGGNCSEGASSSSMVRCSTSECSNTTESRESCHTWCYSRSKCSNTMESRKSCDRKQMRKGESDGYNATNIAKYMISRMREEMNILIPSCCDKEN